MIADAGLSTLNQEILQPKNPLNWRAIKRIMRADGGGDGNGAGTSYASSSQWAKPAKTWAAVVNLARAVD